MRPKPTRRQHHVCQAYLRGWATDEKVWVRQDGGIIHRAHTRDVAVQRDFYKLKPLSDDDIRVIRWWIAKSPPQSRRVHENYLTMFGLFPTMRAKMTDAFVAANADEVAELDLTILTLEEQFHAGREDRVAPIIAALRQGDASPFSDDILTLEFAHFIALQHFRTSAMKDRCVSRLRDRVGFDMTAQWNILSHIWASNVGLTFFLDRKRNSFRLLKNETQVPFITSDQPTVNLLGGGSDDKAPDHMALFYPLSPTHAVLLDDIDKSCGLVGNKLTAETVHRLNAHQVRSSRRQIIAASREALEVLPGLPAEAAA